MNQPNRIVLLHSNAWKLAVKDGFRTIQVIASMVDIFPVSWVVMVRMN